MSHGQKGDLVWVVSDQTKDAFLFKAQPRSSNSRNGVNPKLFSLASVDTLGHTVAVLVSCTAPFLHSPAYSPVHSCSVLEAQFTQILVSFGSKATQIFLGTFTMLYYLISVVTMTILGVKTPDDWFHIFRSHKD